MYYFWNNVDPTDARGQFCDKGHSYKAAIFCKENQCKDAEESLSQLKKLHPKWTIATKILKFEKFWYAEGYHQDYYKKNPGRYAYYKAACGRT